MAVVVVYLNGLLCRWSTIRSLDVNFNFNYTHHRICLFGGACVCIRICSFWLAILCVYHIYDSLSMAEAGAEARWRQTNHWADNVYMSMHGYFHVLARAFLLFAWSGRTSAIDWPFDVEWLRFY